MSRIEGIQAHARGESIADCPWGAGDPDGHAWRAGWISAEAGKREREGTFGATPEEHAAAIRSFGPNFSKPDPHPELPLDKPKPEPHQWPNAFLRDFRRAMSGLGAVKIPAAAAWVGQSAMATIIDDINQSQIASQFQQAADRLKAATDWATASLSDFYSSMQELPDPKDAASVLAWKADYAAAQRQGLDRVGSRKAWVYGPELRRPPNHRSTRPAARRSR